MCFQMKELHVMFKVLPLGLNSGLNLTHLQTTVPRMLILLPYFPVYKSNLCISRPPFCSQKSASFRVSVYKSTSNFILQDKITKNTKFVTKN